MPYDGIFTAAVAADLNERLIGARIDKIFQPTARVLLLHCRQPGTTHRLLLSAESHHARAHITETNPDNPLQAPAFCMLLRKYIDPGRIVSIAQVGLDRVLHFTIDTYDDIGRPARRVLIAELTGRNSNIVLIEEETGRIIDALRRVSMRVNRYRALLPGETYVPPPAAAKADPRRMTPAEAHRTIAATAADERLDRELVRSFEGLGPFAARELLRRAEISPRARRDGLGEDELKRLAAEVTTLGAALNSGHFRPTVVLDETGAPSDFWAFPPVAGAAKKKVAHASEAADAYFTYVLAAEGRERLREQLARVVATARKRSQRKANNLRADLDEAQQADTYRLYGELLTANLYRVRRGEKATVPNYYDGGNPVTIPLDPSLSPSDNAQRYFHRYNRLQRAREQARRWLDETVAEIEYLDQAALHIDLAADATALRELQAELTAADVLPATLRRRIADTSRGANRRVRRSKRAESRPARPLRVVLDDGSVVFIGRNNRQNEQVSLRIARPTDVWLHVKDMPGAHVVLQPASTPPAEEIIVAAAEFAAHFSRARDSGNVAIDWTEARHVRKPRGARPGMVIYDNHKTVFVTPDADRIRNILDEQKTEQ